MTHIYAKTSADASAKARRRSSVAEIQLLRKFEGRQMIEERIERQLKKLHKVWFRNRQ
jgi:hypothetical protein